MGLTAYTEPQCLYKGALYLYVCLYRYLAKTTCKLPEDGVKHRNTSEKF